MDRNRVIAQRTNRSLSAHFDFADKQSGDAQQASTAQPCATTVTAAFARLQRPGSPRPGLASIEEHAPDESACITPIHSPRTPRLASPAGHASPPSASFRTPPPSPSHLLSPGAKNSPCQNRSFTRLHSALEALGAPFRLLRDGPATPQSFLAGASIIYKLKSDGEPNAEEIKEQFQQATKKFKKAKAGAATGLPTPDEATFRPERTPLMNIDVELHFGGGIHSTGVRGKGSYVKVDGWFLDEKRNPKKIENRIGRLGAFASDRTYDNKPIDRQLTGLVRAALDPNTPRRPPAPAKSPARPGRGALQLLAMVILEPELVTSGLSTEFVARRFSENMASAASDVDGAANPEFAVLYDCLMSALQAHRHRDA